MSKQSYVEQVNDTRYSDLHPIVGVGLDATTPFGSTIKTAECKSGTDNMSCCNASRFISGTLTNIISEKNEDDNRPATDSPTFPPCAMTKPVTSLTIPRRSNPAALMIKCEDFGVALLFVDNHEVLPVATVSTVWQSPRNQSA
jgi:hypothetical protein